MNVTCLVVIGVRSVTGMLVDEVHIAAVAVNRQLMRIKLLENPLVRVQTRDTAVHRNALLVRPGLLLVMVARADLLVLPCCSIGEPHGYVTGVVAPLSRCTVKDAVDVRRCQSLEIRFLVAETQHDMSAALSTDVSRDLNRTLRRGRRDASIVV